MVFFHRLSGKAGDYKIECTLPLLCFVRWVSLTAPTSVATDAYVAHPVCMVRSIGTTYEYDCPPTPSSHIIFQAAVEV